MSQPNALTPAPFAVLLIVGLGALMRFSQDVRPVQVVGLTGAGASLGVAIFGFVMALRARRKA